MLLTLENHLGQEKMKEFTREYFKRFKFKHPTTRDFINTFNDVTGEDYNWFYYIISNDINHISGYREGDKKEVEQYLRETLARLNNKFKLPEHSYQHNVRKAYEPSPLCY